jgi:hypothetical protein
MPGTRITVRSAKLKIVGSAVWGRYRGVITRALAPPDIEGMETP